VAKLKLDAPPPPVLLEGDERVKALQLARVDPTTPDEYVDAIGNLWGKAQAAFLDIGRLLLKAKERLPHGEYLAAVEARLPFSGRTAYQIREATRWVLEIERRQIIPLERLPGSYSTIYLLSTLDPVTLDEAEKDGVVRPDLRRAELIAWRQGRGAATVDERAALEAKREKLRRERERLDAELRRIEAQLGSG
jgi:hypothetical protein